MHINDIKRVKTNNREEEEEDERLSVNTRPPTDANSGKVPEIILFLVFVTNSFFVTQVFFSNLFK